MIKVICDLCNTLIKNPKSRKNFHRIYENDSPEIEINRKNSKEICTICWKEYSKIESKHLREQEKIGKEMIQKMNEFGKFK